jgi:hypothetical protein
VAPAVLGVAGLSVGVVTGRNWRHQWDSDRPVFGKLEHCMFQGEADWAGKKDATAC